MTQNSKPEEVLSKRELEVFAKLKTGLPNKLIARYLNISERTIKFHCSNIYRKLHVENRHKLIYLFSQNYTSVQQN